ncbi:MAG: FHA domain-containing protein [Deltaproteobacteria bacterium]|nr:FHA domain-containing protein [Deltaproteobacteria bacterium]
MALTVTIKSDDQDPDPNLSLTLDTPRVVIGRSTSCEVQLPDPSVSARHASIRRDGGRTLVMDEGSTNGTLVDGTKLPPQTPRPVRDGEMIRIGRIWLELRLGTVAVTLPGAASPAHRARAVAATFLGHQLEAEGEPVAPFVEVVAGSDQGARLHLEDRDREYVVGRSKDSDLQLTDELVSRRHITVGSDGVDWVVTDQRSKRGSALGGEALGGEPVPWSEDEPLTIGDTTLALTTPLVEALAEAFAAPDAKMAPDELHEPPPGADAEPEPAPSLDDEPPDLPELPEDVEDEPESPPPAELPAVEPRGVGYATLDVFVVLVALGLLALSIAALMWVLR